MAGETKLEYTREAIQKLHAENYTDLYIADLYGKTELEISRARKKSSYWEELNAPPVADSAVSSMTESSTEEKPENTEKSASKSKSKASPK